MSGDALVVDLERLIDQLIEENRQLKRALAQAEGGSGLGGATQALVGMQRRVQRALDATPGTGRRRAAAPAATTPKPRRKVTDPELLERRRAALAKAREARWGKKDA